MTVTSTKHASLRLHMPQQQAETELQKLYLDAELHRCRSFAGTLRPGDAATGRAGTTAAKQACAIVEIDKDARLAQEGPDLAIDGGTIPGMDAASQSPHPFARFKRFCRKHRRAVAAVAGFIVGGLAAAHCQPSDCKVRSSLQHLGNTCMPVSASVRTDNAMHLQDYIAESTVFAVSHVGTGSLSFDAALCWC